MATFSSDFPNLDFSFGLDNALSNGAPGFLAANIGVGAGGPTIANQSSGGLFNSIFSRNSMFGGTDPVTGAVSGGWVSPLASLGGAIFSGIQGQKQLKLAQDQFKEGKRQFNLNYEAQRKTTNTQLEDRQRARVASNAGAYESVDSYLKRNSV